MASAIGIIAIAKVSATPPRVSAAQRGAREDDVRDRGHDSMSGRLEQMN
ncbi:MAG: hypothetical protein AB1586_10490 [Pseudomonadota bacterium]